MGRNYGETWGCPRLGIWVYDLFNQISKEAGATCYAVVVDWIILLRSSLPSPIWPWRAWEWDKYISLSCRCWTCTWPYDIFFSQCKVGRSDVLVLSQGGRKPYMWLFAPLHFCYSPQKEYNWAIAEPKKRMKDMKKKHVEYTWTLQQPGAKPQMIPAEL